MGKSTPAPPAAPDYSEANREGIFADIETLPTRRLIESAARQGTMVEYEDPRTGEMRTADFRGFGDIDLTKAEMSGLIDLVPQLTQAQLDNLVEFGPQFVTAQREQMQQLDPEGFGLREDFARRLREGQGTAEELASGTQYEEVGGAPELRTDTGQTAEMRRQLEEQVLDQLMSGERLTGAQQRSLEQGVRGAAAARGQALGNASGLREAIAKLEGGMQLGQQRRGEALGLLASGQTEADRSNAMAQQSFANAIQRVQQINQARNVGSQQQLAARQQDVGNIQSYLGLQPIAAQGAAMSGLQQGASPFTMPAGAAGTGFASNIFGTQANIYDTQMSNQSNPLGAVAGTLAGSFTGGFGTSLGTKLGSR
jgi:hypothetical protein